jgi:hypothetical protein
MIGAALHPGLPQLTTPRLRFIASASRRPARLRTLPAIDTAIPPCEHQEKPP